MNEITLKPPIKTSKVMEMLSKTSKMTEISLYLKFRKYPQSNKNNKMINIIFENSERIEIMVLKTGSDRPVRPVQPRTGL